MSAVPKNIGSLAILDEEKETDFEGFVGERRGGAVDEGIDEDIELGTEPSVVDEFRVVIAVVGGRRLGRREVGEDGSEEGVEREEGFESVWRRLGRRHVGEEDREVVDVSSR